MVIDHGRAIAQGTADELKAQVGGERVEIVVADAGRARRGPRRARRAGRGRRVEVDEHTRRLTAPVTGGAADLIEALRRLDAAGVAVQDVAPAPPDPRRRLPDPDRARAPRTRRR